MVIMARRTAARDRSFVEARCICATAKHGACALRTKIKDWNMAEHALKGLKVAILVTDGFEKIELTEPRKALDQAGAETRIVSPKVDRVRSWNFTDWDQDLVVDVQLAQAKPKDFDTLLLPGGVINPDALRIQPEAVAFVKSFFDAGKPVAAICHGPWTVIEAGAARGRRMTSWPSLKTDLKNAGADWVDQEVVVDQGLLTSRSPDDIPAFNREMRNLFCRARGRQQAA
jgi:PfpI family intracellular protease